MQKTAQEKTKYSRNETILEMGNRAKAVCRLCKIVSSGQKLKLKKKKAKNDSLITLKLFCAKNRLRKHQIFEQRDNFENQPSDFENRHHPCKIVSLGPKFKFEKTWEKQFFNHIRVVLCKKQLEKTPNIREIRRF